jgi:hypothetical protein
VIVLQVINMIVSIIVNAAYVYLIYIGIGKAALTAIQITLSVFKLLWNFVFVRRIASRLKPMSHPYITMNMTAMKIFNFIVGPYLATLVTSSNCFYHAIKGQDSISVSYSISRYNCFIKSSVIVPSGYFCSDKLSGAQEYIVTSSVTPPWLYSYKCSSSLLCTYVPVLLIAYAISGILQPIYYISVMFMDASFLERILPRAIYRKFFLYSILAHPLLAHPLNMKSRYSTKSKKYRSLFSGPGQLSRLLLDLAVLATFGLASPLVAVAVSVQEIGSWIMWRLSMGRYLYLLDEIHQNEQQRGVEEAERSSEALREITEERLEYVISRACSIHAIKLCLPLMVGMLMVFWGLQIFDMVGDIYGSTVGWWGVLITVVVLGFPVVSIAKGIFTLLWPTLEQHRQSTDATRTSPYASRDTTVAVATNPMLCTPATCTTQTQNGLLL